MARQHMLIDPAGKIAVIPGEAPVEIRVGAGGKFVHLLESESGHLLLPLDSKFSQEDEKDKERAR